MQCLYKLKITFVFFTLIYFMCLFLLEWIFKLHKYVWEYIWKQCYSLLKNINKNEDDTLRYCIKWYYLMVIHAEMMCLCVRYVLWYINQTIILYTHQLPLSYLNSLLTKIFIGNKNRNEWLYWNAKSFLIIVQFTPSFYNLMYYKVILMEHNVMRSCRNENVIENIWEKFVHNTFIITGNTCTLYIIMTFYYDTLVWVFMLLFHFGFAVTQQHYKFLSCIIIYTL